MMTAPRLGCVVLVLFCCVAMSVAQELPMREGATEIGAWAGGGSGLGHSTDFQYANAGLRLGKVLTGEHGSSFLRGNFEYAVDIMPLYLFFQDNAIHTSRETVYGGAISPVIFKWNFTSGKKIVPFAAAEGTAIFTTRDVPAGDTSVVNFGSGIASGVQILRGDHHAVSFSGHLLHISNASLGNHNPSINIGLQFRIGYQWWR
jgi:lipid A 3-O-deacylase